MVRNSLLVILGAVLVVAALVASAAMAQQPVLPAAYYGAVRYADGTPVASGTVEALVDGKVCGAIEIDNGRYGEEAGFGLKLVVQGDIAPGATVRFRVNGVMANETAEWQSGDVRRVDLTVAGGAAGTPGTPPSGETSAPGTQPGGGVTPGPAEGSAGGGGGTGGGGGGGGAPVPPATRSEGRLTPAAGGAATLGGVARVEVPANALTVQATLTVEKLTAAQVESLVPGELKARLAGDPVDVRFDRAVTLAKPVTVRLYYRAESVAAGERPAAYYYHEARKKWIYLGGAVDEAARTVTVEVSHLTVFAVFSTRLVELTDVPGHWAQADIERLVGLGIVAGYPDRTFKPENNVTRAEFAKLLVLALDLTPDQGAAAQLADAQAIPAWAKGYVGAAVKAGLVKGYEDRTFRADREITRAELAAMVARALKTAEKAQLAFKDASDIPTWAAEGIAQAVAKGIIRGYPDGIFGPAKNATRAETAAMVVRLLSASGV